MARLIKGKRVISNNLRVDTKKDINQSLTFAVFIILFMLSTGALFYHYVENWSWVDSIYFSGVTMTTLGFGDIVPLSDASKLFTVFYSITTFGLFIYSVSIIASKIILGVSLVRIRSSRRK